METFFSEYLTNLQEIHQEMRTAIHGLPAEALDWTPAPEMNSPAVLVVHSLGAERYWIGEVVAGIASLRDREAEFLVRDQAEAELISRLDEIEAFHQQALSAITLTSLGEARLSPRNNRQVTVAWALSHALKHTSLHAGHLQVTVQLWKAR